MSSVHTPGPWKVHTIKDGGNWEYQIRTAHGGQMPEIGKHIATVNKHLQAKGEDNARLIASAPDLGAVLMRLTRSADALLGLLNAADMSGEETKAACRDIADAHNVIQAAGLYGGGK